MKRKKKTFFPLVKNVRICLSTTIKMNLSNAVLLFFGGFLAHALDVLAFVTSLTMISSKKSTMK